MTFPDKLKINRIEDYHTHHLGQVENGDLFCEYETFLFTKPLHELQENENWEKYRREYVVLHLFDKDGNLKSTSHWFAGTSDKSNGITIEQKLDKFTRDLGNIKYQNIEVRPFQIKIDGHTFGLLENKEFNCINLEPSSLISFMYPWDGSYYT
jgi:hypothetical protein